MSVAKTTNTSLFKYILHLADNALILGQRNAEWTGHGPILEQDIALSNIALDLIGQSRNLYQYAATLYNQQPLQLSDTITAPALKQLTQEIDEDDLAFLRDENEFYNCLLVEQTNGDWAKTILRMFFFSNYQFLLYRELLKSKDIQLAAIAEKSLKEVTYHLRWSSEWVIRLGDGTAESHRRMQLALQDLWKYTGELTVAAEFETLLASDGIAANLALLQPLWMEKTTAIFEMATLDVPENNFYLTGGKNGRHTEAMGYILAEMQYLQRTYPHSKW